MNVSAHIMHAFLITDKEDTNHGKAQSQQHRHKMMHKNEHKRQGAQAKFSRNN